MTETAEINAPVEPDCALCQDAGTMFGHADDCDDDDCALNGDIDSCGGLAQHCCCKAGAAARARGVPADDDIADKPCEIADGHIEEEMAVASRVATLVACCENEDRNMNGGCNSCGDPCF